jgi:tetratricopeptide (TPR) repeat protein
VKKKVCFAVLAALLAAGCGGRPGSEELAYREIANSYTGEELVRRVTDFEIAHPGYFKAKFDLAMHYIQNGDLDRAYEYFLRAEGTAPRPPVSPAERSEVTQMFACLSQLYFNRGDYEKAGAYNQKAAADPENGPPHRYFAAHLQTAQNRREEALSLLDSLYREIPQEAAAEDLRLYMILLRQNGRESDCIPVLEDYFSRFRFFPGLGLFASECYQAAGQTGKALLAAFWDVEYDAGLQNSENPTAPNAGGTLAARIRELETLAAKSGVPEAGVLDLIRGSNELSTLGLTDAGGLDFFMADYFFIRNRIRYEAFTNEDFNNLLTLEPYFSAFPLYYWNLWQGILQLAPALQKDFLPILEKIIALESSGPYASKAWGEITRVMGFTQS